MSYSFLIFLRNLHEGRLQSSWTHIITPSRNFVEMRWRSLFRSTSLDKRCTSYNAPPISRKRAADRWSLRNFLPRSSVFVFEKAQKSHGARSGLYGGCSNGIPPIHVFQAEHRIQFRYCPMRFLGFSNHEMGAPRHEISKWCTVCSTFSRSGCSVERSASLAERGTSKRDRHRTSTKFLVGVIRWVHELCKRPSYFCPYKLIALAQSRSWCVLQFIMISLYLRADMLAQTTTKRCFCVIHRCGFTFPTFVEYSVFWHVH
jgi:hypothetical protein